MRKLRVKPIPEIDMEMTEHPLSTKKTPRSQFSVVLSDLRLACLLVVMCSHPVQMLPSRASFYLSR